MSNIVLFPGLGSDNITPRNDEISFSVIAIILLFWIGPEASRWVWAAALLYSAALFGLSSPSYNPDGTERWKFVALTIGGLVALIAALHYTEANENVWFSSLGFGTMVYCMKAAAEFVEASHPNKRQWFEVTEAAIVGWGGLFAAVGASKGSYETAVWIMAGVLLMLCLFQSLRQRRTT